jgi:PAS domain S-box-containing protein
MKKRSSKSNKSSPKRKRVEDEIKLCEAKFRVLFDNVSSGVAIYEARDDGRDFVFTDFNRAAEEIEQVKKEDLIGRSVLEPDYPMPIIDEADRGRMGRAFNLALKGSRGNEVPFRLRRKDGEVIRAEMSWQPIYDTEHGSLGHRESIREIGAAESPSQRLADSG